MITLQCLGAASEVTGSCHLVRVGDYRILLDCGLFQGSRRAEERNRSPFAFDPKTIDAVVLSHAHIDHSGRLPMLVKHGFRGPIYTHKATRELCDIMLKDSAILNERDTEHENRRRERRGDALIEPLYSLADAVAAVKQFKSMPYDRTQEILPGVSIALRDAGHILGSAIVELWLSNGAETRKIVFSGDLGHFDAPILQDPAVIEQADLVLMESTYGDRLHRSWEATRAEINEVVEKTRSEKGNILIPAFAVGRSQMVLYWMAQHFKEAGLEQWRIFLDSPMAIRATGAYARNAELYDTQARELWQQHQRTPLLPNLRMTKTPNQSKAISRIRSGAIIIAGSGMCTGGRIVHHLRNNAWRRECSIIIVGYQAHGTVGRALVEGASEIRLWGERVKVAAKVHTIGGLSAHADQSGLIKWYRQFSNRPALCLVHGEETAQRALAERMQGFSDEPIVIAQPSQTIDLLRHR